MVQHGFQHPMSLLSDLHWPNTYGQAAARRLNDLLAVQKIKDAEGKTKTLDTESIPHNLEARRRLEFFTNSLFMHMPEAPPTRKMHSFCVLTPYYEEDVIYSLDDLSKENEDGISILFYLQKIYPDEWQNFLERIQLIENTLRRTVDQKKSEKHEETVMDLRLWASYRGQTLARTVRGMMYYKTALILQGQQEGASNTDVEQGLPLSMVQTHGADRSAMAQAELKFVYVVTCQIYGEQKKRGKAQAADILYLMQQNSSLRVAYIDVVETTKDRKTTTSYYSKLVKAGPSGKDEIIYSIKLPGEVRLGEGKPENQNHAIIFTRGDAIQTIDMNQVSGGAFLQLLACPEISVNVFAQVMLLQLFI
jgi:callose synthase